MSSAEIDIKMIQTCPMIVLGYQTLSTKSGICSALMMTQLMAFNLLRLLRSYVYCAIYGPNSTHAASSLNPLPLGQGCRGVQIDRAYGMYPSPWQICKLWVDLNAFCTLSLIPAKISHADISCVHAEKATIIYNAKIQASPYALTRFFSRVGSVSKSCHFPYHSSQTENFTSAEARLLLPYAPHRRSCEYNFSSVHSRVTLYCIVW